MKFNKYLLTGIAALAFAGGAFTTANAATTATKYTIKANQIKYYSTLPHSDGKFSTVTITTETGVRDTVIKVTKTKTVHHVKYGLVGKKWVKLSNLVKFKPVKKTVKSSTLNSMSPNKLGPVKVAASANSASSDSSASSASSSSSASASASASSDSSANTSSADSNDQAVQSTVVTDDGTPNTNINWNDSTIYSQATQAALDELNQARTTAGLPTLKVNDKLTKVAEVRVNQLVNNFSHYDTNGTIASEKVVDQLGYDWNSSPFTEWGENIAQGYVLSTDTIKDVGQQGIKLFQSEGPENGDGKVHGHYENDMSKSFNSVGLGFKYDAASGNTYLAVEFGVAK